MRLAKRSDLPRVLEICAATVAIMCEEGLHQWGDDYPLEADFVRDIERRELYVQEQGGAVLGFVCINRDQSPEYRLVDWKTGDGCLVLHRMAVAPEARRQGIGRRMIAFAEQMAFQQGVCFLRTDTHSQNCRMNALFAACGLERAGVVRFPNRDEDFYCYEKRISSGELSETAARLLLETAGYGVFCTASGDGEPYGVPVHFVYLEEEQELFFHCALTGRKLQNIAENPRASVTAVTGCRILPASYTTAYESVIASGHAELVSDPEEKRRLLRLLCERFAPGQDRRDAVINKYLSSVAICRVELDSIHGKRSLGH
ncbi:GNAT family N-acetyltransferase [Ligaoa zhengdingensis]